MDIKMVKAETPEDRSRVDEFLHDHFFPDMPLALAFGLDRLPPPPRPPSSSRHTQHEGDFSLMAVDPQGDIVGIAINTAVVDYDTGMDMPHEVKQMMELLEWAEHDAELETLPERTIELRVLAVHREWRRRGVARSLAEESMRQAREGGFRAMRVCCTSEYTARLARGLGWKQHYRLRYTDYPSRAGSDVTIKPQHPHDFLYYYVTDL